MESFGDKTRAFVYALLVHLACIAVMFIGLLWTQSVRPVSIPGPVIEAELVGIAAAPRPRATQKPKPAPPKPDVAPPPPEPPKPPEPKPQDAPAEPQHNDAVDREKIAEMATQQAEQAERAQEEKQRREQTLLEAQQRERLKQLEDTKRKLDAAAKQRKLEQEKLAQLDDVQKQQQKPVRPPPQAVPEAERAVTGANGQDDSLQALYYAAIQNAVTENWLRPDNAQAGLHCMLHIVQIPGGDVLSVEIATPCNADPQTRNSIEQAVKRAAPLPYKGYEREFRREIRFNFSYDG